MSVWYESEDATEMDFRRRSYPIDLLSHRLGRRAEAKKAMACNREILSFNYPSSGAWGDRTPKRYGFNIWDSCDNYDWDSPDLTNPKVKYETEHVLEWQIVGAFFTYVGEQITTQFDHPNPNKNVKLNFCQYWLEQWSFANSQTMENPLQILRAPLPVTGSAPVAVASPPIASIPASSTTPVPAADNSNGMKRTPFQWLASQYPYKDTRSFAGGEAWLEEMPLLEKKMNGQNKEAVGPTPSFCSGPKSADICSRLQIFSQKITANGKYKVIRDEDMMNNLVQGKTKYDKLKKGQKKPNQADQGIMVIKYLREMIGTLKYMQEKEIASIFAKEKKRLGSMIDAIDKQLHSTPRKIKPRGYPNGITYAPWQEQGLGAKWDTYMDDVFDRAKQRATDYMNLHLGNMEKEWDSQEKKDEYKADKKDDAAAKDRKKELQKIHKDMLALINKTRKEWDKVKDWSKPDAW
jgi:hypothetical protein